MSKSQKICREFALAKRKLEKLDEDIENLSKQRNDLKLKMIPLRLDRLESVRITENTDQAERVRTKVLQNDEVTEIMKKYKIGIHEVALVHEGREYFRNLDDLRPIYHSKIEKFRDYLWGGPLDRLKVFFGNYSNGRFWIEGYSIIFPETNKKKNWKSIFQGRKAA